MRTFINKIFALFKKYKEIILYLIVGALTTAISIFVQWIFTYPLPLHTFFATLISLFISITFAFFTNKIFVFESKTKGKKAFLHELYLFYSSRAFTAIVELIAMPLLVDVCHFHPMITKAVVSIVIIILNYVFSKFIVFRKRK